MRIEINEGNMTNCKTCADHGVVQKEASLNEIDCPDCFGGKVVPMAKFEELQHRYDNLSEKLSNAGDRIEELETERDGLKEHIANARRLFRDMAHECEGMLDQIKAHQQHV